LAGIDILVNNASAINLTGTLETPMKKVDLMLGINLRGTYLTYDAENTPVIKHLNTLSGYRAVNRLMLTGC